MSSAEAQRDAVLSLITDLDSTFLRYCDGQVGMAELTAQINATIAGARRILDGQETPEEATRTEPGENAISPGR